jgi:hypothetical protein
MLRWCLAPAENTRNRLDKMNRIFSRRRLGEDRLGRVVRLAASILFAAGFALGIFAVGADTISPSQNHNSGALPEFPANAGTHVTPADLESAFNFQNGKEIPAQTEVGSPQMPAPATRSAFMASWSNVSGAIGYRLDVSTSNSFSSYVNGYHDLDVGNITGQVVTGLNQGTTYYYRVRAYDATGAGGYSNVMTATTSATIGLIINATFDSSITTRANAATIEAMIHRAISIYESLFSDPITVKILFRYSTTGPDGSPFPSGVLSQSDWVYYTVGWNTYIHALVADAITGYDATANASLPTAALSTYIRPSSANGRAVSLNTPPAMFANGAVGSGGTFDGIVSLNSATPLQLTRPISASNYDAQRATEHEMDEILGLGSRLSIGGSDLRPQDLFSWSSAGVRNLTSSGTRYFSINRGSTKIVYFNQNSTGDYGDWLSTSCPQAHPYVQNAFGCSGQSSDVTVTSPEGINLDVIGYNLVNSPAPAPTDFNNDGRPDYLLYNGSTGQTVLWYLNNNVLIGAASGPTLPTGYSVVGVADFNRDGHADYLLFNPSTLQTVIWYLNKNALIGTASGPTIISGWKLVATGDFNKDGKPDWVLYNPSTQQTLIWYFSNNIRIGAAYGPTLPAGYSLVGVADFNRNGKPDYLLFNPTTHQSQIMYLSGAAFASAASGPTITGGYALVGTADFNGDGKPDYLLFNLSTRQTVIWYLNNNVYISAASGPTPPAGWSVVAP